MEFGKGPGRPKKSPRWRVFAQEYLADPRMSGAEAAKRAGYSHSQAAREAVRLLGRPGVQAIIKDEMEKRAQRTQVDQDRVLRELVDMATVDITEAYDDETGKLLPLKEIPANVRRAMLEIRETEFGPQVKWHDKTTTLGLLAKHVGIGTTTRVEAKGGNGEEALQVIVQVLSEKASE